MFTAWYDLRLQIEFNLTVAVERDVGEHECVLCLVYGDTEYSKRCVLFLPMPPHVLVDFVVFPPGHGRSVTDF